MTDANASASGLIIQIALLMKQEDVSRDIRLDPSATGQTTQAMHPR